MIAYGDIRPTPDPPLAEAALRAWAAAGWADVAGEGESS